MARFYCGIGEQDWNHHPVAPGPYACISPIYGKRPETRRETRVAIPPGVQVIQDSGAFCDGPGQRLSFEQALARQVRHAEAYSYANQITHRASYDLLIDEKWADDGRRHKARWREEEAEAAVRETVEAARFLARHRAGLALVLSAQGVSARQYLACAEQIVPLLSADGDIFGLGGWCITGLFKSRMRPVFQETMHLLIPFLGARRVAWVHLWGVVYPAAIGELQYLCDRHGLLLSTDSAGPSLAPVRGEWGFAEWRRKGAPAPILESCKAKDARGNKAPTCPPGARCRGLERARHVAATSHYLEHIDSTKHYRPSWVTTPRQAAMLLA